MPFVQRQVYPVNLAGRPVPTNIENPFECVSNQTLCDAMRQLASLLKHSDTMFSDLETTCGQITSRVNKLSTRVKILGDKAKDLNAKKNLESYFGISFENCCLAFRVYASDKRLSKYNFLNFLQLITV